MRAGKGTKRKGRPKGRENPKPAKRPAAPPRSVGVVAPGQQCTQCGTQVWRPPVTFCQGCWRARPAVRVMRQNLMQPMSKVVHSLERSAVLGPMA